jgi:peptidoglycan/LPS O-acetylase OafA/YrhL
VANGSRRQAALFVWRQPITSSTYAPQTSADLPSIHPDRSGADGTRGEGGAHRRGAAKASGRRGFGHIPALDGLRAFAVLTVMGYHAGVSWLPGGLLGVDVFFVLSGFLITSLLLTERRNNGRISLARFWGRRARRLLPAVAFLLLSMIAWAQWVSPATSRASLRGDALSTLGYVANWRFIISGQGYFDHFAPQSPLLHTWSVAVEEQFYLIWPLLLVLVLRRRGRRSRSGAEGGGTTTRGRVFLLALVGATASGVLMAMLSLQGANPNRLYYGTDTRALPLLLGCTLAALRPPEGFDEVLARLRTLRSQQLGRLLIQLAGVAGAAGLVLCWLRTQDRSTWLYRGGFAVVAIAAVGVLISCADAPRGPLARLLSLRPLRYIGAISYGLYLYHWPLFQLLTHKRTGLSGAALLGVRFAATFAIAVVSYHLVEQPIRRGALSRAKLRQHFSGRLANLYATAALPSMCLLLVGGLIAGLTLTTQASAQQIQLAGGRPASDLPTAQPPRPKPPELNSAQKAVLNRPIRVLIEGDSLAFTLGYGLAPTQATYHYKLYNLGILGCGIARGGPFRDDRGISAPNSDCETWPQIRAADVKSYDPDVSVLLTGRWEVLDRVHNGVWMHVGEPVYDAYLSSELDTAISVLSAGGAKVLLLTTPCFAPQEAPDGSIYAFDDPARLNAYNGLVRAAAARHPGVASVYDLDGLVCPGGKYTATIDGQTVRDSDGVHIAESGGPFIAKTLAPELLTLGSIRRSAQAMHTEANEAHPDPNPPLPG